MPVTLRVRSNDPVVEVQRRTSAQAVITHLGSLPQSRILCFLDDEDSALLRDVFGAANRGAYRPIKDNTPLAGLPEYVIECIYVDDGVSLPFPRVIDDLVYVHGRTCADEVGLAMTLAHELQHAIQHARYRQVWAVNSLIHELPRAVILALKLKWTDIPIELEARIVSKHTAECLLGEQPVRKYIERKIAERITEDDAADWQVIQGLSRSASVDLAGSTYILFKRLKPYRSELEAILREKKTDEDFSDIELDAFLES